LIKTDSDVSKILNWNSEEREDLMTKRIVVIGGVACGPKAAARARRCDPTAKITIIEEGELISYASCGLPYYISGAITKRNNLLVRTAVDFKNINNIDVLLGTKAEAIDRVGHKVQMVNVSDGQSSTLEYDKLVIATGTKPVRPPLQGRDLKGVFWIKDVPDTDRIQAWVTSMGIKKAVIIGAGLIGIEMAEVLMVRGLEVTIVEAMSGVLPGILDEEISTPLARYLTQKGIVLKLQERVASFEGEDGCLRKVITDKSTINADITIIAIGVRPDVQLARDAGLPIGPSGAIAVNEMLQTNDTDIYAGGDCAESTHLLTGAKVCIPMGSTANKHGRVIGTNVTGGKEIFPGVIGTAVVKALQYNVGRTGLGEKEARKAGYDVVTALAVDPDRPTYYPGARDVLLKIIVDSKTGKILGGQGMGRGEIVKRIDVLATAITFGATVDMLANIDLGYAPPYNTPLDPIHSASNIVRNKLDGMVEGVTPAQIKAKLDSGEDFILLDVRNPEEYKNWRIEAPQVIFIPQNQLLQRMNELPREKEIIVTCRAGVRAYQMARALKGADFPNVKFAEGSIVAWPYDVFGGEKEPA
jgi:NADPH-dependent 2,4-dienoyl-CoA reductase/sulfur reductase-like enzyme/rhodanese-related sulfurtransferase